MFNPAILLAFIVVITNMKHTRNTLLSHISLNSINLTITFLLFTVLLAIHLHLGTNIPSGIFITSLETLCIISLVKGYIHRGGFHSFLGVLLLTFCLTTGELSIFTIPIAPFYSVFRWPFKWLVGGAPFFVLVPILVTTKYKLNHFLQVSLFPALILLITFPYIMNIEYLTINTLLSSYKEFFREILNSIDQMERIAPIASPEAFKTGDLSSLLSGNTASYHGVLSLTGYDALLDLNKEYFIGPLPQEPIRSDSYFDDKLDLLRAYGISQYLYLNDSTYFPAVFKDNTDFSHVITRDRISLYFDSKAAPIASQNHESIPFQIKGNSVHIETKSLDEPSTLILGFMKENDNWTVRTEGSLLTLQPDPYQRISTIIPRNTKSVIVTYREKSLYTGIAISTLFILIYLFYSVTRTLYRKHNAITDK